MQATAAEAGAGDVWLRRMATVLRDEQSGICFRDLHGFNSTGSQISWLPAARDVSATAAPGALVTAATHLFTGASDPAIARYKAFRFASDAGTGDAVTKDPPASVWDAKRVEPS